MGVEAAWIVGLLINRVRRRLGEAVASLIADLSLRFINLPSDRVDAEIEAARDVERLHYFGILANLALEQPLGSPSMIRASWNGAGKFPN